MITATIFPQIPSPAPMRSLPLGPLLSLPTGEVEVLDDGKVYVFNHQWIGAVGISDDLFLTARQRTEKYIGGHLLHELFGYLAAHNCELIPVDYRCPASWLQMGSLSAIRRLLVNEFLDESCRYLFAVPMPLSTEPRLALPLAVTAADGAIVWDTIGKVADALAKSNNGLDAAFSEKLMRLARRWERCWGTLLTMASDDDLKLQATWLAPCDQAWWRVVQTHLLPFGYVVRSQTLARLL